MDVWQILFKMCLFGIDFLAFNSETPLYCMETKMLLFSALTESVKDHLIGFISHFMHRRLHYYLKE